MSLGNYRRRVNIIADILCAINGNAKKTHIMFQANLSYAVLQKYLSELTGACLISFEHERRSYSLTDKGRAFLDAYQAYSKMHRNMEESLKEVRTKKRILDEMCANMNSN